MLTKADAARLVVLLLLAAMPLAAAEVPFDTATTIISAFDGAAGIALGDLNGNGTLDVTVTARHAGVVRHYSNNGGGAWTVSIPSASLDSPYTVAVGDIDGDGDGDILVGQLNNIPLPASPPFPAEAAELLWFANPKNGSHTGWVAYGILYFVSDGARKVALADLDGDGDLDVVFAHGGTNGGIAWVENDGDPTDGWGDHHTVSTAPVEPFGLAVADLDGDGDLDLVAADSSRNLVTWYENDGTDFWTERTIDALLPGATDVAVGDIDGDGDPDVVAAGITGDEITWYANSGSGSGWSPTTVTTTFDGVRSVALVDMDGDGDLDILATAMNAGDVAWFDNTSGDGSAWVKRTVDAGFDGAFDVAAGDIDGDGDPEIFASGFAGDTVAYWRNRQSHRRFMNGARQTIRDTLADPRSIAVADVNGDGLQDVVTGLWDGGAVVAYLGFDPATNLWWENSVASGLSQVRHVSVADMDGDGDLDILAAAVGSDAIYWWENDGGVLPTWTRHTILTGYGGAHRVVAADFDRDGDMDVAVAGFDADDWSWVENTNGLGTAWTKRTFTPLDGAFDLAVGDLNFDGTPDIVATGYNDGEIRLALNYLPGSPLWGGVTVATGLDGPRGIALGDFDKDGDLDIVVVVRNDNLILWFENDGTGINWTRHNVGSGVFANGVAVRAGDIDGDGDVDIVATNQDGNDVFVWRNNGDGSSWSSDTMEQSLSSTWDLELADLNRDGKLDIAVAAGGTADSLVWYPNIGDQFTQHYWVDAPDAIADGATDVLFAIRLVHQGRTGFDADLEPSWIQLAFTDAGGTPLTSTQVNNLLDRLELYRDTDGSTYWSAADTLVATDFYISLTSGVVTWVLPDGQAGLAVAPGTGPFFFVVATALAGAEGSLIASLPAGAVAAEDVVHDVALSSEPSVGVVTGVVQIGGGLFSDGFESGDLTAWSSSTGG